MNKNEKSENAEVKILATKQINFYIIRAVYDIINGYVTTKNTPENDFYHLMGISKSSYDQLVYNGDGYKSLEKKANKWEQQTGIKKHILVGKQLFEIDGFELAEIRNKIETMDSGSEDFFKEMKGIRKKLKESVGKNNKDSNFNALIKFSKNKKSIIDQQQVIQKINEMINILKTIGLEEVKLLDDSNLDKYIGMLERYIDILKAHKVLKEYYKEK